MIDWNKMTDGNLKAFEDFLRWHKSLGTQWHYECITDLGMLRFASGEGLGYQWMFFNDRDLYDYFDSVGMEVFVLPNEECTALTFHVHRDSLYDEDYENFICGESDYEVRTEAETVAFTRAFQIRESRLD